MITRLHVGTYVHNGGDGLYTLDYETTGSWTIVGTNAEVRNASFACWSARHRLYYFVDEQNGTLSAYRGVGDWKRVARVATGGYEPCYAALNDEQSLVAVANYGSGNVAVFHLDQASGIPLDAPTLYQNVGCGPNFDRQDGPHAHCACFSLDGCWLYHVDLGTDQVLAHPVDSTLAGRGEPRIAYAAPPGSGPRHLALHPVLPFVLLLSELASTLSVLHVDGPRLVLRQTVSTLPEGYTGESLGGHLSLNAVGDRVYVTNRGHDSVAVFTCSTTGTLDLLQHVASGGASPRALVLLEAERRLVLANEERGSLTTFAIEDDGTLSPLDVDLAVPGAVFLLVAPP